jgi:hypothetical protein
MTDGRGRNRLWTDTEQNTTRVLDSLVLENRA